MEKETSAASIESRNMLVQIDSDYSIWVRAQPLPGERCSQFMKRIFNRQESCDYIKRYRVTAGSHALIFRIPFALLKPALQRLILLQLFPNDTLGPNSWQHVVTLTLNQGRTENLEKIAAWFTGAEANVVSLAAFNNVQSERLVLKQVIRIPNHLLLAHFQLDWVEENEVVGELSYHKDNQGPYAEYRMKSREALYTNVVLRFTDRLQFNEVMEAVDIVAKRSGIVDVKNIDVGFPVKIPLALVSVRYQPMSSPDRLEYELNLEDSKKLGKSGVRLNLDKVVVLLDTGHGGCDPGAMACCGICEDEYVYDIACRVKRLIETSTRGKVSMLIKDTKTGYTPRNESDLPPDENEVLLTTPPYDLQNTVTGVNLRWVLANATFRQLLQAGMTDEQVILLSLHANALHPQVHGAMLYYPSAAFRKELAPSYSEDMKAYKESAPSTSMAFSRKQLLRSERLSLDLSRYLMEAMRKEDIDVHSEQPVRGYVIQSGAKFLPAVLKYSQIPTALLIETVNLKNTDDCRRMKDSRFREQFAAAIVEGLINYFAANGKGTP